MNLSWLLGPFSGLYTAKCAQWKGLTVQALQSCSSQILAATCSYLSSITVIGVTVICAAQTPLQFAAPSIFGADGFSFSLPILRGAPNFAGSIFGSKCQQVAQAALQSTIQVIDVGSRQWQCGLLLHCCSLQPDHGWATRHACSLTKILARVAVDRVRVVCGTGRLVAAAGLAEEKAGQHGRSTRSPLINI
jgi:hypothetical protein